MKQSPHSQRKKDGELRKSRAKPFKRIHSQKAKEQPPPPEKKNINRNMDSKSVNVHGRHDFWARLIASWSGLI